MTHPLGIKAHLWATLIAMTASVWVGVWIGQGSLIPTYAAIAAFSLILIPRKPFIWLLLIIPLTAFRNFDNVFAGGLLSWSKLLTFGMLFAVVVQVATKNAALHVFRDWLQPLLILFWWALISLAWAYDVTLATWTIVSLFSLIVLQGLIYTVFKDDFPAVERAIYVFIGAMLVFGLVAIYVVYIVPDSAFSTSVMGAKIYSGPSGQVTGRFSGFYADANSTAFLLTCAILMALALANTQRGVIRYALWAAALFLVFPLTITYSRSGLVTFLIGVIYLGFHRGSSIRVLFVLGVGGIVFSLYQEGLTSRFDQIPQTGWGARLYELETGIQEFTNAPLTGIGLGSFRPKLLAREIRLVRGGTPAIHNTYLKFLVELGLPGFMLLLWFLVRLAIRLRRNYKLVDKASAPKLYWMNAGLTACFIGSGVFATAQGLLNFNLFWILLGILAVTSHTIENMFGTVLSPGG